MSDNHNVGTIERSKNIQTQIFLTFFLKVISIFLSFFVIRITIDFLGKDLYGIWIILLSIVSWLAMFDVGVGNGLRNKLTIALSRNNLIEGREYISTAYIIMTLIGGGTLLIFGISLLFVNWQAVFNSTLLTNNEFKIMMIVYVITLIFSFILSLINSILFSFQKSALTNIGNILTNIIFTAVLLICKNEFFGNIIRMVVLYGVILILSNLIISIIFFSSHRNIIPSFKFYSRLKTKGIVGLGGSFFIIQIAVLLIFTVDNFLVIQFLGSEQVSVYNIVFKLFSIFTIGFGIIITPFWSAFTEAKEKRDMAWMRNTISKLNKTMLLIIFGIIIMYFVYQYILDFWLPIDKRIVPPISLIASLSIFVLISTWNNIYSFFLNGIGAVKMQMRTAIIGSLINIPLAFLFTKYLGYGLAGIVIAMCISLSLFSVMGPIETYKFFKANNND